MNRDAGQPDNELPEPAPRAAGRASDLALLLFAALLPFSPFSAFTSHAEPTVGQPAPDFAFQGSDGKAYSLSGLLEEGTGGIVLAFFPKAFTPG